MRSDELDVSIELQFHTEKSQAVKDASHGLYEIFRDPETSVAMKTASDAELRRVSAAIEHPVGIDKFVTLGGVDVKRLEYSADRK